MMKDMIEIWKYDRKEEKKFLNVEVFVVIWDLIRGSLLHYLERK